jgi:molecular chaperone DnaK (HSP70)
MAEVGIDLGTTTSGIAVLRNVPQVIEVRGRQLIPSVVAWDPDAGEMLVGHSAKDQSIVLDSVISVKRHMGTDKKFDLGGKSYKPEEISALILGELKRAAEEKLGESVESAVITIPAYFSEAQNEATKKAGERAGFKSVRLLAEPIAAALAYGAEEKVLVYDLGGGTFDVAIIDCFDFTMLGLDGDNWLGGDDFDNRLIAHLAKEVKAKAGVELEASKEARQLAKLECERVKIDLSSRQESRIRFQTVINEKFVNLNMKVTREEFEVLIMELVDRSITKVQSALDGAKKKDPAFTKESIETVLLVGGSTYVPLVQKKVTDFFGREPSKKVNPDLAVTLGAAVHTASGPAQKGVHRVRLDPMPLETSKSSCNVKGRTTSCAKVEVRGGATTASGEADADGKFLFTIELIPDKTNDIEIVCTDDKGEERKSGFQIRHDSNFDGQELKPRKAANVGGGLLARSLGIGLKDNRLGLIVPEQTPLPCSVEALNYCIVSSSPGAPGSVLLRMYEGDIPCAPLNTHLGEAELKTGAGGSAEEPVEITFQVTEERLLTVTARMINFPDKVVTTQVKCDSPTGSKLHVLERTDRVLNEFADKIRPDDKAKLSRARQTLVDLCEQYKQDPNADRFERIQSTGLQLRTDLDKIEAAQA